MGSEIVHVFVGKDRKKFAVHKKLICSVSDFFDKAFNGGFKEARENSMNLDEDDPLTFAVFLEWLYTTECVFDMEHRDVTRATTIYSFADKIRCNTFKNFAMDYIQDILHWNHTSFSMEEIKYIFAKTYGTEDEPIRKFCGAMLFFNILDGEKDHEELLNIFHNVPEALREYLKFQTTMDIDSISTQIDPRLRGDDLGLGICEFHIHVKDDPNCTSQTNIGR